MAKGRSTSRRVGNNAARGSRRRRTGRFRRVPGLGRIRAVTGTLVGRSEGTLVSFLEAQVRETQRAAAVALGAARGEISSPKARAEISRIEHKGDQHRANVVNTLKRTIASPIDREDIFRLSRSIDDVLDNLRDFVRELDLFELGSQPVLTPVLEAVAEGIKELRPAARSIGENPAKMRPSALAARKNDVRMRYQLALVEVLSGPVTVDMLRLRELLRRLDVIGLRLGEAADALADGAIKRSH